MTEIAPSKSQADNCHAWRNSGSMPPNNMTKPMLKVLKSLISFFDTDDIYIYVCDFTECDIEK